MTSYLIEYPHLHKFILHSCHEFSFSFQLYLKQNQITNQKNNVYFTQV